MMSEVLRRGVGRSGYLAWVKSHIDIFGNEAAGAWAKTAAEGMGRRQICMGVDVGIVWA